MRRQDQKYLSKIDDTKLLQKGAHWEGCEKCQSHHTKDRATSLQHLDAHLGLKDKLCLILQKISLVDKGWVLVPKGFHIKDGYSIIRSLSLIKK